MVITTRSGNTSMMGQIIEQQITQLRYTGLFLALTGNLGDELPRIYAFYDVIKKTLKVARTHNLEPTPNGMPVIYNPSSWTSDQLCGYAGRDVEITAEELLASYMEIWLFQLRYEEPAKNHFLKCALWHSEKHGRDPLAGLSLLLDLFAHGFFVKLHIFGDVLNSYLRFHALGIDFSFLAQTTVANAAFINENLGRVVREYEKVDLNLETFEALIAATGDLTMDLIQQARQAQSLDEWLIGEACVRGPVWWLAIMYHASKDMNFGILTRRMLSKIEEIGADLHATIGYRDIQAQFELPPVWDLTLHHDIAKGYRERFPDDSWLDRMTEDRMVFPYSVREQIRAVGLEAFTSPTLPAAWRFPSEKLAFPLCVAHRRNPSLMRSFDFSPEVIQDAITEMELAPDESESKVTARRRLQELEGVASVIEINSLGTGDLRLHELRALYPWHVLLCLNQGIRQVLRRDLDGALDTFQRCLLIEPNGAAHWLTIAHLAELKGFADDAAALNEIARLVKISNGTDQ